MRHTRSFFWGGDIIRLICGKSDLISGTRKWRDVIGEMVQSKVQMFITDKTYFKSKNELKLF